MLVALGLWTVVDAPRLHRAALGSPLGTRRTAALDILGPILAFEHQFLPAPTRRVAAAVATRPVATVAPTTTPTATTTVPPRPPGPERVLVVGDSVAGDMGNRLAARLDAAGNVTTLDTRPATGLTRPDAFDWPRQLALDLARDHPDVVVAMWGANDAQAMPLPSGPAAFGSPGWVAAYSTRVRAVADEVAGARARLVWVGEPVMRSAFFDARMQALGTVVRAALAGRAAVTFTDTHPVLATPAGRYADALPDDAGRLQLVRATDGIHLTWAGADRLAAYVAARIEGSG